MTSEGFSKKRTKPFKTSHRLGLTGLKRHSVRCIVAHSDSLRHFPIVKVVPVSVLDGERSRMVGTALGGIVSSAVESLEDLRSLWEADHDDDTLKESFQKLHYQLEYLRKCLNGD
jgi:hypothetical protein